MAASTAPTVTAKCTPSTNACWAPNVSARPAAPCKSLAVWIAPAMDDVAVKLHVQRPEAEWVKRSVGLSDSDLVLHDSGDVVTVGDLRITLMHTPGHTPGSQCFLVDGKLVAGDTLFLEGCGRTDLPGSDPDAMYESLTQRLAIVPDDTILYPGHLYAPDPFATMGETRQRNYVFRINSLDQWRMFMG